MEMEIRNQIRIGNESSFSALPPTIPFEYAIANGFDAFEWFPDKHESGVGWYEEDIDMETRSYIKETAIKHNIRLSVHLPLLVNPLDSETHKIILDNLRFAMDIGAHLINIHLIKDRGLGDYVKAIMPLIRRTDEVGLKLAIENTPLINPEDFNKMFAIIQDLKGIKTEHVGICLDVGHANLCDSTRNDYLKFIDQIAMEVTIIHVHLHENYGDQDSHLPLFTGPAQENDEGIRGLIRLLKGRNFSGTMILEQWPQPPQLLNQARDKLYQLYHPI